MIIRTVKSCTTKTELNTGNINSALIVPRYLDAQWIVIRRVLSINRKRIINIIVPFNVDHGEVDKYKVQSRSCKWSLGLMPFGLESFGLIQLVTWLNFFELSVSGIDQSA